MRVERSFVYRLFHRHGLWLAAFLIGACAVAYSGLGGGPVAAQSEDKRTISEGARRQIAALLGDKERRTSSERKIDPNLLFEMHRAQNRPAIDGLFDLRTGVEVDEKVSTRVEITGRLTRRLMAMLRSFNAVTISVRPEDRSILISVPLIHLDEIAKLEEVTAIARDTGFDTNQARESITDAAVPESRRFNGPDIFASAASTPATSEGGETHRAGMARAILGVDGTGVKIGVLSDGVLNVLQLQSAGELPPDLSILSGQSGGPAGAANTGEGSAMLEIVHDIAPGAQLYFATAGPTQAQFAANILALRAAGCDIIIDDVTYLAEAPFQDGVVSQAVNAVTVSGALYFTAAGNGGNKNDGTSGVWEGDFAGGGPLASGPIYASGELGEVHDFGTALFDTVSSSSGRFSLKWADPLGASGNDYDLFILNPAGTSVIAFSTGIQNGTQDPFEFISGNIPAGSRVVVVKFSGAGRYLRLDTHRGTLATSTAGQVYGHNATAGAITTAAANAFYPYNGLFGPFPDAFARSSPVEGFSADGPRRIFFSPDGKPITPGNFSSRGGVVLEKPDITAADGVITTVPGFVPFWGTSAAAPHAGALMALLKAKYPSATNAQLIEAMKSTAIDIEGNGVDRDSGAGIFMPLPASGTLGSLAVLVPTLTTAAEANGNANGRIDPGETGDITIRLENQGTANASIISAVLTANTPGVSIDGSSVRTYSDIPAGSAAVDATPWKIRLADTVPCGTTVELTLTVTYAGGVVSSQILPLTVGTGMNAAAITTTLDTVSPLATTAYSTQTGVENGRPFRNGVPSACAMAKTAPGIINTGSNFNYDAYVFTAYSTGCVTVKVTSTGNNLFVQTYDGSFDAASPGARYLADSGNSSTAMLYSFNVIAGQRFTVVVTDTVTGGAATNYTLNASGVGLECVANNNSANGFEGDINASAAGGDLGSGDGDVTVADLIVYNRVLRGELCPATDIFQQKLDSAPRGTSGNGLLGSSDGDAIDAYARHYSATDFNPATPKWDPTPTGGPTSISNLTCLSRGIHTFLPETKQYSPFQRQVGLTEVDRDEAASTMTVDVELISDGTEGGIQFSLGWDASKATLAGISGVNANPDVALGENTPEGTKLNVNAENAENGAIGIVETFTAARSVNTRTSGSSRIVRLTFHLVNGVEFSAADIRFTDDVVRRQTVDLIGQDLDVPGGYGQPAASDDKQVGLGMAAFLLTAVTAW